MDPTLQSFTQCAEAAVILMAVYFFVKWLAGFRAAKSRISGDSNTITLTKDALAALLIRASGAR